jgi:hypothetical protein
MNNVLAVIVDALSPLGDPVRFGEFAPDSGGATPERYYTLNYTTLGDDFADDEPQQERALVQVHFFCPLTYDHVNRVRETKRALTAAGLSYPEVIADADEDGQHIIFETEWVGGVD